MDRGQRQLFRNTAFQDMKSKCLLRATKNVEKAKPKIVQFKPDTLLLETSKKVRFIYSIIDNKPYACTQGEYQPITAHKSSRPQMVLYQDAPLTISCQVCDLAAPRFFFFAGT